MVPAGGHTEESVVKQLQHVGCAAKEGGCGGRGTHWSSLCLVYSTQMFVYINTCPVHGEVHINDM